MYDVIIVGAGIAGISAGRVLIDKGLKVNILDKGKAPGGRLASRKLRTGDGKSTFDYGCKYIEVEKSKFLEPIVELIRKKIITDWNVNFEKQIFSSFENNLSLIGKKSIREIALNLATDLNIENNVKVVLIKKNKSDYLLVSENGEEYKAKKILLTMPVPQTLELLKSSGLNLEKELFNDLNKISYSRNIVALFTLNSGSKLKGSGGLKFNKGPISFITDNNLKGINNNKTAITVEMSHTFSELWWNQNDKNIADEILKLASEYLENDILDYQIHKWKYSIPLNRYHDSFAFDNNSGIFFAGDAFNGNNVESAYLSGYDAGKAIVDKILKEFSIK